MIEKLAIHVTRDTGRGVVRAYALLNASAEAAAALGELSGAVPVESSIPAPLLLASASTALAADTARCPL